MILRSATPNQVIAELETYPTSDLELILAGGPGGVDTVDELWRTAAARVLTRRHGG